MCPDTIRWMRYPELADMVAAALHHGERRFHRYQLRAYYVVMPHHVHLLVTLTVVATRWPIGPMNCSGAMAKPFGKTKPTMNPVKTGLVSEAQRHPWPSAASRLACGWQSSPFFSTRLELPKSSLNVPQTVPASHRLFNPATPEAGLKGGCGQDWPPHTL